MKPSRPIVICTARYSDNLGDGVIAECMEYVVKKAVPDIQVFHLDLAGRSGYVVSDFQKAHEYKNLFYKLPSFTRSFAVLLAWPVLMLPKLRDAMKSCAPKEPFNLIFGGGQILSDVALNFPLKFHAVSRFAAKRGALLAVNAVGVSSKWSVWAKCLFGHSLNLPNVVSISVRDQQSHQNLLRHLSLKTHPHVTVDPGIFAQERYGITKAEFIVGKPLRIGVGIAHPSELATQAENPEHFAIDPAVRFWGQVVEGIRSEGHIPVLFSNGAFEDESFLDKVRAFLKYDVDFMPRASTPEELSQTIASFHGIISHRLHANIVAFSLGVPAVSLVWDPKVRSFAEIAGNQKWCLPSGSSPAQIVDCLKDRLAHPVDEAHLASLKAVVEKDVEALLCLMKYIPR